MLTKESVMLNKYRPWNLSIPELCNTIVKLYDKLEQAEAELEKLHIECIRLCDDQRYSIDKYNQCNKKFAELQEVVKWYLDCIKTEPQSEMALVREAEAKLRWLVKE